MQSNLQTSAASHHTTNVSLALVRPMTGLANGWQYTLEPGPRLIAGSRDTKSSVTDLDRALESFAKFLRINVSNGDAQLETVVTYRQSLKPFLAFCSEMRFTKLSSVGQEDIELYRSHMQEQGLGKATIQKRLSVVKRFFDSCLKYKIIDGENPAQDVRAPRDLTPLEDKIKFFSKDQIGTILGSLQGATDFDSVRNRLMLALMSLHGLRRVEIHRLDHENFGQEEFQGQIKNYFVATGKRMKRRRVYLRDDTYSLVMEYSRLKTEKRMPLSGHFFSSANTRTRLANSTISLLVTRALDEALGEARDGRSCHALRHSFGTLSVAGGAKVEHVRDAMGHEDLETTGIYVRAVDRAVNNPSDCIGVAL
jgi:site-specific recombinase XerD